MTDVSYIARSVNRAWRLLNDIDVFMVVHRGLNNEIWQRNVEVATHCLSEAANNLLLSVNRDAYGELTGLDQQRLWESILDSRNTQLGVRIISQLGRRYQEMSRHVREADRVQSRCPNGFPVAELHRITSRILNASPSSDTSVEQAAAREGDPIPRVSSEEALLYQRIVLHAIRRSNRERHSYRNTGEAVFEAFSRSFLPALGAQDILEGQVQGRVRNAILGSISESTGLVLSVVSAVRDASGAYYRQTDSEYRLNYWVYQGCLAECNNNADAAGVLQRRLINILQRMDALLEWLERHHNHSSYVSPSGEIRAAPRASVIMPGHTRTGINNCNGAVQGVVRGPANQSPLGTA